MMKIGFHWLLFVTYAVKHGHEFVQRLTVHHGDGHERAGFTLLLSTTTAATFCKLQIYSRVLLSVLTDP